MVLQDIILHVVAGISQLEPTLEPSLSLGSWPLSLYQDASRRFTLGPSNLARIRACLSRK